MFARIGPTVNARGRLGDVPERIDDIDDPRLADYRQLKDAVARRRIEGDELFVAEGPVAIDRMIASGHPIRSVLVLDRKYDRMAELLAGVAAPIFVVDDAVLLGVAGFDLHRGAIAAGQRRTPESLAEIATTTKRVAVLEGLNDPENLGAVARSARALGVEALVLDPTCIDPYTRRTVRVSMGEILMLRWCRVGGSRLAGRCVRRAARVRFRDVGDDTGGRQRLDLAARSSGTLGGGAGRRGIGAVAPGTRRGGPPGPAPDRSRRRLAQRRCRGGGDLRRGRPAIATRGEARTMSDQRISRFDVPELDDLPDDMRQQILAVQERSGFVPNVFLALARRPAEFRAFFDFHATLMDSDEGLSKAERELIVVATSAVNQCLYCVVAHGAILRIRAKDPLIADQVAVNPAKADLTERQRAIVDFALRIARDSASVTDARPRGHARPRVSATTRSGTSGRSRPCSRSPTATPTSPESVPTTSSTAWGAERAVVAGRNRAFRA